MKSTKAKSTKIQPGSIEHARKFYAEQKQKQKELSDEKKFKVAVRGIRPKKSERMSFIFVGVRGGRSSSSSNRKGYIAYVNKLGKIQPVIDRKSGKKNFKARKFQSFNLLDTGKKTAIKKVYAKSNFKKFLTRKRSSTWEIMAKKLRADVKKYRSIELLIVRVTATIRFHDGRTESIEFDVSFKTSGNQRLKRTAIPHFVGQKVYALLAQELSLRESVTSQSASFIRRLPSNKGKKKKDWVTKKGEKWGKAEYKKCKIISIDYTIIKDPNA